MEADFGFFGNMLFSWVMNNPFVVSALGFVVAFSVNL